jgi:hypothetical protein
MAETTKFDEVAALKVFDAMSKGELSGDGLNLAIYNLIGDNSISTITNWVEALPNSSGSPKDKESFKKALEIAVVQKEVEKLAEKHNAIFEKAATGSLFADPTSFMADKTAFDSFATDYVKLAQTSPQAEIVAIQQISVVTDGTIAKFETTTAYIASVKEAGGNPDSQGTVLLVVREEQLIAQKLLQVDANPKTPAELEKLNSVCGNSIKGCKGLSLEAAQHKAAPMHELDKLSKDDRALNRFFLQSADPRLEELRSHTSFAQLSIEQRHAVLDILREENEAKEKSKSSSDPKVGDGFGEVKFGIPPEISANLNSLKITDPKLDEFGNPTQPIADTSFAANPLDLGVSPVQENGVQLSKANAPTTPASEFSFDAKITR